MPPRLPRWFSVLPEPVQVLLGCAVFAIAYFLFNQIGFYHWGVGAWIPFVAFWVLPTRCWPALVLTQMAVSLWLGVVVSRVSADGDNAFLGHWPGAAQFLLGNFVNPVTNMIGPWVMRRAGIVPWQRVTPQALVWLHVAALANFVPPVIKDVFYVLIEGRVGDVRHNVRGGYVGLGDPDDWRILGEFALSHLLGGFVGIMITVPLALWWFSRREETGHRAVLAVRGAWLLPLMASYVMLAWAALTRWFAQIASSPM